MGKNKDVISIYVGQAGVQIASACWELFCIEHNISCDGRKHEHDNNTDDDTFHSFFSEDEKGHYIPRALLVDLEPGVLDEIRTGMYGHLFHGNYIITSDQDAANNYARGRLSLGRLFVPTLREKLRLVCESSSGLQGFMIYNSYGGGTGTGIGSLIMELLSVDYAKDPRFNLGIFPGAKMGTALVEPYNSILYTHDTISDCDVSPLLNNEALFNVCVNNMDINYPTFSSINHIISQLASSITATLRFESFQGQTLEEIIGTNLIPYPRLHFPVMSYAPLLSDCRAEHSELTACQLTRMIFDKDNTLLKCNMDTGRYMSCLLLYRGEFSPGDVNNAISKIKMLSHIKWVDWCPTGFKIGICHQGPSIVQRSIMGIMKRSVMMMTNQSAVSQAFRQLSLKFDSLFEKRAFVHWFVGEGLEECEFTEAREDMHVLLHDYQAAVVEQNYDRIHADATSSKSNNSSDAGQPKAIKGRASKISNDIVVEPDYASVGGVGNQESLNSFEASETATDLSVSKENKEVKSAGEKSYDLEDEEEEEEADESGDFTESTDNEEYLENENNVYCYKNINGHNTNSLVMLQQLISITNNNNNVTHDSTNSFNSSYDLLSKLQNDKSPITHPVIPMSYNKSNSGSKFRQYLKNLNFPKVKAAECVELDETFKSILHNHNISKNKIPLKSVFGVFRRRFSCIFRQKRSLEIIS